MVKNPPAMQGIQVWSLGREDALEKRMATYASILALRIPWTEEPGKLQFMGSQRVYMTEWLTLPLFFLFVVSVTSFPDDGLSDWCEVIPHCMLDLHFSNNEWHWASFHVLTGHLYVFFGELTVYVFCPCFDWAVCFSDIKLQELLMYFKD